jgi:hypothetical protein
VQYARWNKKRGGVHVDARTLRAMSFDAVVDWMGRSEPDSINHNMGMAELRFRELLLQVRSSEAQIKAAESEKIAADAAVEGTKATEKNARYMLASVVVAALAALVSAISVLATIHPAWFK